MKKPKRIYRANLPPFGGGGMTERECRACHERWFVNLSPRVSEEGNPLFRAYEHGHQCGQCAFYSPLTGDLGMDWGVCGKKESPHDGKVVFEHHTCLGYTVRDEDDGLCPVCDGTGEGACRSCRGTGKLKGK